ncbi:hypothetical protein ElyMa_006343400 [Elysia marginata]|uniref:Secreted protein n=1 Tax=Elysia marginata TaxID=1093978 RepID=A0AAV4HKN0_9GAST|nr:hypothetical protein ElyMa_006343400 [Elysia marginata]
MLCQLVATNLFITKFCLTALHHSMVVHSSTKVLQTRSQVGKKTYKANTSPLKWPSRFLQHSRRHWISPSTRHYFYVLQVLTLRTGHAPGECHMARKIKDSGPRASQVTA